MGSRGARSFSDHGLSCFLFLSQFKPRGTRSLSWGKTNKPKFPWGANLPRGVPGTSQAWVLHLPWVTSPQRRVWCPLHPSSIPCARKGFPLINPPLNLPLEKWKCGPTKKKECWGTEGTTQEQLREAGNELTSQTNACRTLGFCRKTSQNPREYCL